MTDYKHDILHLVGGTKQDRAGNDRLALESSLGFGLA